MLTQPSAHIQFATEELSVNGVKYVNHLKLVQAEANIVELQKEKVQLPNLLTMALLEAKQNAERVVELQGCLFSVEAKLEAIDQKPSSHDWSTGKGGAVYIHQEIDT